MRIAVRYDKYSYAVHIVLTDDYHVKSHYFTGIKVVNADWDNEEKRVKSSNPDYIRYNKIIVGKYKEIELMVTQNPMARSTGVLKIENRMEQKKNLPTTLNKFWDTYTFNTWRRGTRRFLDQRSFVSLLRRFNPEIYWSSISRLLILDFDKWLTDHEYADTTISLYHQYMRAAIKEAVRNGLLPEEQNPYGSDFRFNYAKDTNNVIYLEDFEIKLVYKVKLVGIKKVVRDLFIISCYTAMDFSTIGTLSKNSFYEKDGRGFIRIQRVKTKGNVIIPVHPVVEDIMKEYDYSLPKTPCSLTTFNKYLKEIAKIAGIKQLISITAKREPQLVEKWELVSSHTGRRSAATNMYLAGIPPLRIRLITGHNTEESFLKYIRISKQYNADLVAESQYFQKNTE